MRCFLDLVIYSKERCSFSLKASKDSAFWGRCPHPPTRGPMRPLDPRRNCWGHCPQIPGLIDIFSKTKKFHSHPCETQGKRTTDLCFGSVAGAYKSYALPPLGSADHNCVYLVPSYRPIVELVKAIMKSVKNWTVDNIECLKGCFEWTEWDMFYSACDLLDELSTTITDYRYVCFCVDVVIPTKQIKIYPNNKPWITKALKEVIN